jgi:O-antigen/teichoic acid export membrane protein
VQPLVPSLSRDVALDAPAQGRIRQATHLNALIAIEAGIFLYVLADWVIQVLAPGGTAREHILGLQIAAIIYALYSLNAPGFYILSSVGGARTNAVVTLSSGIVSLVLIFLGARYFGLLGALAGNAGYLGTLLLVVAGLRKTGIALSRYLNWIALPLLCLAIALIVGTMLQGHLLWRAVFLIVQAALFMLWFLHDHSKAPRIEFGLGRASER